MAESKNINRRQFLKNAAKTTAVASAFTFVPSRAFGANERLNIAVVGVGGMGNSNLNAVGSENIVALCDVDDEYAAKSYDEFPQAKRHCDFRKMLEKEKDIEAVVVATPDHTHAVIAMAAMKMGKHVYVQKPLTHNVYEARMLTEAAKKYKVITQMGNQGHSGEGIRLVCEWVWSGAIGKVKEAHAWTNRPHGYWAQGIERPEGTPPVPKTLDWDLWLGPAQHRPYNPAYHPFSWRGFWDFGTGALGDMACHIMDPVYWSLKLGYPIGVRSISTPVNNETAPISSMVEYKFPARGDLPPVTFTWYDGGLTPTLPDELGIGRRMGDASGGALLIGDKGKIVCGCYGKSPRLLPDSLMQEVGKPPKMIPRVKTSHEMDWVRACKEGKAPSGEFSYSGPFTEVVLLGNLAIRTNKRLEWDGPNMKVTNLPEAEKYVRREYRQGWTL